MSFDELKNPVGRPTEDELKRADLTEYKREAKFRRLSAQFFDYWYPVVVTTAKGKEVLIHSMEEFGGEVTDKFEELDVPTQETVITAKNPFKELMELTNLKIPRLFLQTADASEFKKVFLNHEFIVRKRL